MDDAAHIAVNWRRLNRMGKVWPQTLFEIYRYMDREETMGLLGTDPPDF